MTAALDALWKASRSLSQRAIRRKALPPMLFFSDPARTPRPELTLARLPRGSGFVFRAFGAADALAVGRRLARLARKRGVVFLVGAEAGLAVALRADGIHFPERLAHRKGAVGRLSPRFIVTAAAHGLVAARRARLSGVDAIVVSPVFQSTSPSAGAPIGPLRFAALVGAAGCPVYALGGVNEVSARGLMRSGAVGLASVSALSG
jgi:thiamine-phosphate pyrophosphorylase